MLRSGLKLSIEKTISNDNAVQNDALLEYQLECLHKHATTMIQVRIPSVVVVIIVVVAVTIHISDDVSRQVNANEHKTNEAEGGEFLSWRTWSFATATCKLRLSV